MYVSPDCKNKAHLKRRVNAGETVTAFAPGLGKPPENGSCSVEGPQNKAHSWYARVDIKNGVIVKVT